MPPPVNLVVVRVSFKGGTSYEIHSLPNRAVPPSRGTRYVDYGFASQEAAEEERAYLEQPGTRPPKPTRPEPQRPVYEVVS